LKLELNQHLATVYTVVTQTMPTY